MGKMLASSFYQLLKNLEGQGKRKEQYPMSHKACRFICKNLVTVSCDTLVSQGRWTKTGIHRILTVTQPFFQTLDLSSTSLCWILVLRTNWWKIPFFIEKAIERDTTEKESVSSHREMGTSSCPTRNDPFMLWSELVTLMKKSKPRQSP